MPSYNFGDNNSTIELISTDVAFDLAKEFLNFSIENGSFKPEAFVTIILCFILIIFCY